MAVGVYLDVGSRHERPHQQGLAHFIEHMVFKGTRRYSARQLLRKVEGAGAEINAFTARDHMFFYIYGIDRHGKGAVEVLHEMLFHPLFPEKELEKERNVILEEIEMYKDSPEDDIIDRFFELLFPGHPLGTDILGTPERIRRYCRDDLMQFHLRYFRPERVIYTVSGGTSKERVRRWFAAVDAFPSLSGLKKAEALAPPPLGRIFEESQKRPFHQTHVVVGLSLPPMDFEGRLHLSALSQYLGGNMRAVLWQQLREQKGYVYHVASYVQFFKEASVLYIHFATNEKQLPRALRLLRRQLQKLADRPISAGRLKEVRRQMISAAIWREEDVSRQIFSQAWQWSHYRQVIPMDRRIRAIEGLTSERLFEFAHRHLRPDRYAMLIYHAAPK